MKAAVLIRKLLGASVVTKSRLGFLVAVVTLITIGGKVATTQIDAVEPYGSVLCLALGLAGLLTWAAGRWAEANRGQFHAGQDAAADPIPAEHPLDFLRSGKYWGLILMLSGAMLTCILRHPHLQVEARAPAPHVRTNHITITVTNVVTITNKPSVVAFPRLVLTGLVLNGSKSSALINGRVLCLGETISNVVLVAVDAEHATVALEGQTKVLVLGK